MPVCYTLGSLVVFIFTEHPMVDKGGGSGKPITFLIISFNINPKRAGGAESAPLQHFLLYLCRLLFFRAETSWLFSFKPCARFKTIFIKIGPRIMTRCCVIARWVQRKTDFVLNYTQIVFFVFQDTLPLCFILFVWFIWSKNMCKHTLTHIIAKKCNFCLKK